MRICRHADTMELRDRLPSIQTERRVSAVNDRKHGQHGFWGSLPGLLTGAAAVVTALVALLAAFSGGGETSAPRSGERTSGDNSPIIKDTTGNVTIAQ
jgi:hypothetical protein